MSTTTYVLGFAFDNTGGCILMRRKKDDWQKGLVSGIGGKVEKGESIMGAMVREFFEETGIRTEPENWVYGLSIPGNDYILVVYRAYIDSPGERVAFPPCEEGDVFWADELPEDAEITARWLYYFCKDHTTFGLEISR